MLGSNHIKVRCSDGVTRLGRIKGKIKKRVWIREGDILIVIPWEFQDDKCDIVYRYTTPNSSTSSRTYLSWYCSWLQNCRRCSKMGW